MGHFAHVRIIKRMFSTGIAGITVMLLLAAGCGGGGYAEQDRGGGFGATLSGVPLPLEGVPEKLSEGEGEPLPHTVPMTVFRETGDGLALWRARNRTLYATFDAGTQSWSAEREFPIRGIYPSQVVANGAGFAVSWHTFNRVTGCRVHLAVLGPAGWEVSVPYSIPRYCSGPQLLPLNDGFAVHLQSYQPSPPGDISLVGDPGSWTTTYRDAFVAYGDAGWGVDEFAVTSDAPFAATRIYPAPDGSVVQLLQTPAATGTVPTVDVRVRAPGGGWSGWTTLFEGELFWSKVTPLGSGLAAVWREQAPDGSRTLQYRLFEGGTWSVPVQLASGSGTDFDLFGAASGPAGLMVYWNVGDWLVARTWRAGLWSPVENIVDWTVLWNFNVAVNDTGFGLAWLQSVSGNDADTGVWAATNRSGSWVIGPVLAADPQQQPPFRLGLAAEGDGFAVHWERGVIAEVAVETAGVWSGPVLSFSALGNNYRPVEPVPNGGGFMAVWTERVGSGCPDQLPCVFEPRFAQLKPDRTVTEGPFLTRAHFGGTGLVQLAGSRTGEAVADWVNGQFITPSLSVYDNGVWSTAAKEEQHATYLPLSGGGMIGMQVWDGVIREQLFSGGVAGAVTSVTADQLGRCNETASGPAGVVVVSSWCYFGQATTYGSLPDRTPIVARVRTASDWWRPEQVLLAADGDQTHPALVAAGAKGYAAAWPASDGLQVRTFSTTGVGPITRLGNGFVSQVQIVGNAAGCGVSRYDCYAVTWNEADGNQYAAAFNGTWHGPVQLDVSSEAGQIGIVDPQIQAGADGFALTWTENHFVDVRIRAIHFRRGRWSQPETLATVFDRSWMYQHSLTGGPAGFAVAWAEPGEGEVVLKARVLHGDLWLDAVELGRAAPSENLRYFEPVLDFLGTASDDTGFAVAWTDEATQGLYARRFTGFEGWSEAGRLDTGDVTPIHPRMVSTGTGYLAAWGQPEPGIEFAPDAVWAREF